MANSDHNKAAKLHDNAAKSHRAAAEQHGKGDHALRARSALLRVGLVPNMQSAVVLLN